MNLTAPRPRLVPVASRLLGTALLVLGLATTATQASAAARRVGGAADPTPVDLETALLSAAVVHEQSLADGVTLPDASPEPLLDAIGADLPCGTPLLSAAARALGRSEGRRLEDLALLLAPPRLAVAATHVPTDGGLVIRHDVAAGSRHAASRRDLDRTGAADSVEALAEDARLALARCSDLLGIDAAGDLVIHVAATPFPQGATLPDGSVVVSPHVDGEARLEAAAHQVAHALLRQARPGLPDGLEESLATWMTDVILGESGVTRVALNDADGWRHPDRALLAPGLLAARREATFFDHVSQALQSGWLGEVLAASTRRMDLDVPAADAARLAFVEALDEALGRRGSSLTDEVAAYQLETLERELRAGRATVDDLIRDPGADVARAGIELPPFGQLRFELETPPVGGLRLAIAGDPRAEATALALLPDGTVSRFALEPDLAGERSVRMPGGRLVRVVVLVQAPAPPADWTPWDRPELQLPAPGDFVLAAAADPSYPFVMGSLAAATRPGQVTLDWTTSSEEDVAGWIVERSVRLAGPYVRVSPVPMPAQSLRGETASYAFVDSGVRAGRRYHYRLRALTSSGLSELSPVVSAHTLPEPLR